MDASAQTLARQLLDQHVPHQGSPRSTPNAAITQHIQTLPASGEVKAGLLLLNGEWDLAHQQTQALKSAAAAHWHALVHRHEPDPWNSNYWYRQTGDSPIFAGLVQTLGTLDASQLSTLAPGGQWKPALFTEAFEAHKADDTHWVHTLDQEEKRLLMAHCLGVETL